MIDNNEPKIQLQSGNSNEVPPKAQKRGFFGWLFRIIFFPFWLVLWPFWFVYKKIFGLDKPLPIPVVDSYEDYIPEEESRWSGQIIFVIISLFVIVAGFWVSRAEINAQVRAQGNIVPPTDVQVIQARLSGVVTEINISLGSKVKNGDVLFKMQDKDVIANFDDNVLTILSATASIMRLKSESKGLLEINFPEDLVAKIPNDVAQEQNLFSQRMRQLERELDVLDQEMEGLANSIREKNAEIKIASDQVALLEQEYDIIEPLVEAEHEPKIRLIELQGRIQNANGSQELAELAIHSLESDLAEIHKRKLLLADSFKAKASEQLVEKQYQLSQAVSRKSSLEEKVRYAEIKSKHDGVISALHLKTNGGFVSEGSVLAELIPESSAVLIRAQILPKDLAEVRIGQMATISLTSYDRAQYGHLEGVVTHIARNVTEAENMPPYYETEIKLTNTQLTKSSVEPDLVAGMELTVDILGGKRTILEYVMSPILKAASTVFREI